MNYHGEVIIEFARRTRANLEFVEAASAHQPVHEVTQLANSLLGLLVFPRERYLNQIPKTPLRQLEAEGWPAIRTTYGEVRANNLWQLTRLLRNSIAHCNVRFVADDDGAIAAVELWNRDGKGKKTWATEITIADLRSLVYRFIDLLESEARPMGQAATDGADE